MGNKIFIATPMYGGVCHGLYTKGIAELYQLCAKVDIEIQLYYIFNESLITRARNYCVDEFLRSDATHLMFIDSDIGFNANDVLSLLAELEKDPECDVIGAPYPKKHINWNKVHRAAVNGVPPQHLESFSGDFVFNASKVHFKEPSEVFELGTGFMMIKRDVFARYAEAYPHLKYVTDQMNTTNFTGREIHAYFDCVIEPVERRYLSEDYFFCRNVKSMGGKIMMCAWMHLVHVGSHVFNSSVSRSLSV